jgi:hypothetical protein
MHFCTEVNEKHGYVTSDVMLLSICFFYFMLFIDVAFWFGRECDFARFEVLVAMLLKIQIFWDVASYCLLNSHRRFEIS